MSATTATPVTTSGPQPTALPVVGTGSGAPSTPAQPLPGAAAGTASAAPVLVGTKPDTALTVPLDAFARRAGPDAQVKTPQGSVSVHAVFQQDPTTKEMTVSLVDETGRLIRMIPPDSVAKMIAAMAAYRGR